MGCIRALTVIGGIDMGHIVSSISNQAGVFEPTHPVQFYGRILSSLLDDQSKMFMIR